MRSTSFFVILLAIALGYIVGARWPQVYSATVGRVIP